MLKKTLISPLIVVLMLISLFSVGFSSWNIQSVPLKVNVSIEVGDINELSNISITNIKLENQNILFDSAYLDSEGRIVSNSLSKQNLDFNISGTVKGYNNTFLKIKTNLVIDDKLNSDGTSYREVFYNLVQKEYIEMPIFSDITKESSQKNGLISNSSYWTNAVTNDQRSFRINSSFKWGKFFNYLSPSLFFDSSLNNGYKAGNDYTTKEITDILSEIDMLNGASFHVYVSLLIDDTTPYSISYNPNGGTFNQVEQGNNLTFSNLNYYDEFNLKAIQKNNYEFLYWENNSVQYYSNRIYYVFDFLKNANSITLNANYKDLSSSGTITYLTDKDNYIRTSNIKLLIINKNGTYFEEFSAINASTAPSKQITNIQIGSVVKVVYSQFILNAFFSGFSDPDAYGYRKVISTNFSITLEREVSAIIPITFNGGDFNSKFDITDFATKNVTSLERTNNETTRNYELNKDGFIKIQRVRGINSINVSGASLNSDGYYKVSDITGITINCTNKTTLKITPLESSEKNDAKPNVKIGIYNDYSNNEVDNYALEDKTSVTTNLTCSNDEHFIITQSSNVQSIKSGNTTLNTNQNYSVTQYSNITISYFKDNSGCFTKGTPIMMANGLYKNIEDIKVGDIIKTINHETGMLEDQFITYIPHREEKIYDVLELTFSNGKTIKVLFAHGFMNCKTKEYEEISYDNVNSKIGNKYLFIDANGVKTESELVSYRIYQELTESYSISSAYNLNHIINGALCMSDDIQGLYNYFELDNDYKYDQIKKQQDIGKYGLLKYEEVSYFMSREIYELFNVKYLNVSIGKGLITIEIMEEYIAKFA